jgi:hypothetical protein
MEFLFAFIMKRHIKTFFESGNWKIGRKIMTVGEYEGEIKEGKRHGLGKIIRKNGDILYGEFENDKCNGKIVASIANGNRYEGEYKDDKRHGKGVLTFANGNRYEGEFKDNL